MDPREYDWQMGDLADQSNYPPGVDPSAIGTAVKNWWSSQPSWAERAKAENQRTAEAFQRGGMGAVAQQLATDTTEAQDLASAFGAGTLAGPRSLTANLGKYKTAQEMLQYGKTTPEIRKETNWFPIDKRGNLAYEIPDRGTGWIDDPSTIPRGHLPASAPAEAIYRHPAAYEAYPDLGKIPVIIDKNLGKGVRGGFDPPEYVGDQPKVFITPDKSGAMRSVFGHELLGHGVQNLEQGQTPAGKLTGWSIGGNPAALIQNMKPGTPQYDIYQRMLSDVRKPEFSFREYADMLKGTGLEATEKSYKNFLQATTFGVTNAVDERLRQLAAHAAYRQGSGEEMARAIQARMNFGSRKLKEVPFEQSMETPIEQQIFNPRAPLKPASERPGATPAIPDPEKFGMSMGDLADRSRLQLEAKAPTGFAPGSTFEAKTPSLVRARNMPTAEDIAAIKAAAVQYGRKGWPTTERGVFSTTPEAYAETTKLVPQVSIKQHLPGQPWETSPADLPNRGRALPIIQNTDRISENIAQRLAPLVEQQSPLLKFYHTGPVIRGLEQHGGLSVPQANTFMRDWAGQGAATSPRTQTPPNLRNSSYLMYERARGNPLTPERYATEGNIPGFPMMGMHVDLAEAFAAKGERPWVNPKPTTFRENWSGNLRDVTGDTHNIRSTLYEMDQVKPGSLPRGWFSSDKSYAQYKKEGFRSLDPGDIVDTLGTKATNLISRQTEYLPMTEPWYGAAKKLGIAPAEAQSGGWFSYGDITGLQSPPKTIVNLLNDQVAATARALGVPPEKVVEWWSQGKIPLAGVAGAAALSKEVMGETARRDQYQ